MQFNPNVANSAAKKGTGIGLLEEVFQGPSESSAAGLQRAENQKARAHATSERQASELFNKSEAAINRDFQERMSNTSYQRMMADLKDSGINPMFAISQGGAATPSGSSAQSHSSPSNANYTKDSTNTFSKILGLVIGTMTSALKVSASSAKSVSDLTAKLPAVSNGELIAKGNENVILSGVDKKTAESVVDAMKLSDYHKKVYDDLVEMGVPYDIALDQADINKNRRLKSIENMRQKQRS